MDKKMNIRKTIIEYKNFNEISVKNTINIIYNIMKGRL